ncbi:hypothetical protein NQ317_012780 [Molorchus minor]|uniref:Fibronectin type-III domain-containing protein n=1 Tax=Molorchus minor TaxID=1323400 RepID=A0ABQ9K479_9CUCU|nr:hypothetical protein NQ317_012780 [Molorchus minor]
MVSQFLRVVLLVACVAVAQIYGDDPCSPLTVQNVSIDENSTLSWEPAADDSCTTDHYLVHIHNLEIVEYTYIVRTTTLALDFLPVCQPYRFIITPISPDNVQGVERIHFARMPLPLDANLTVGLAMVSEQNQGVTLSWVMASQWEDCAQRFRVIIDDEDDNNLVDVYTSEMSIDIYNLIPCTHYAFGVVALYNVVLEGPVTVVRRTLNGYVQSAPRLASISATTTSVDLTVQLNTVIQNRCTVNSIEVDVKGATNFNVSEPVDDTDAREPVTVSLTGLQAGSIYLLNLTSVNTAGQSAPTILAVQTANN